MKGSVCLETRVKNPYWYVSWPEGKKRYKIMYYLGESEPMFQRHNDKKRDIGFKKAEKLRALMQGDVERKCFRIEKYTGGRLTDIIPYLEEWLEARQTNMTPGGYKKYKTSVHVHLIPFFTENPVMLHEVRYDTLIKLMNWVPGSGKNKKNTVDTLRCCLRFAWKSGRISVLPPFPEKKLYDIKAEPPEWLPRDRFYNVIAQMEQRHRPFFMWLYLHLRRPGEAMALLKTDYDPEQDVFIIRRGISDSREIERTKTGDIHIIPCHEDFKFYMNSMPKSFGPYFFTCEESRKEGKRYTERQYRTAWMEACNKAGESIDAYRGTKTSRASQMVNEEGMNIHDLQIAGDWASLESVKSYARANIAKKRSLLERKVLPITRHLHGTQNEDNK